MARLIAESDLILTARLPPDAAALVSAAKQPDYVSISLEAPTVLKGAMPDRLVLRHYADRKSISPANEVFAAASGRSSTLFLVLADGALYLASDPQFAIRGADGATVTAVRAELTRQAASFATGKKIGTYRISTKSIALFVASGAALLTSSTRPSRRWRNWA